MDNVLPPGRLVGEEARHALWFVCDAAAQGGEYRGGRHQAGRLVAEVVVDGGDGDDVLSLVSQVDLVDGMGQGEARNDVVEVVEGSRRCQLPAEAAKDQQLTFLELLLGDAVVGVRAQLLAADVLDRLELRAEEETSRAQQLERGLWYP